MKQVICNIGKILLSFGLLTASLSAFAGEGLFGWVYTLDLQPKGSWEIEQKVDLTTGQAAGTYDLWKSRTGIEYGLTDNFQITGYLNAYSVQANKNSVNCEGTVKRCTSGFGVPGYASNQSYNKTEIDGGSLELIWRLSNPVLSPIGVGLYLEPTLGNTEDSIEARLLLQSNFLDDRLVFAVNLIAESAKVKFDPNDITYESTFDIRYGASYRFQPNWFAGIEGRFHNDFDGAHFGTQIQRANFIGPNLHYANKDFWMTAAWLYQIGGTCWEPGTAECSGGKVWDSHGKNQFIVKVGFPLP